MYGQTVNFRDMSAGIPTSWNWSFPGGNPSSSNLQNPTITYPNPGVYTVRLRVSNSHGSDSLAKTAYIRVRGPQMNTFLSLLPPNNTRLSVSSGDTSRVDFIWQRSSTNPLVRYKWKIQKIGTTTVYTFQSNSNGSDTVISVSRNILDSLALIMGTSGDSVRCVWRGWAYNGLDSLQSSNGLLVTLVRGPIGIQVISNEIPQRFALGANYPNPFNPTTKIRFDVPDAGEVVKISVFDVTGREIAVVVNQKLNPGKYEVLWNAEKFSSGIYFLRMNSGDFADTRKMILIK
ncbi:MAG: T9SS type A sorting domain-containing protein [Ignavibacteria bacterium]|nr:T9SS type A sorting domain-containing protein [Ignavibacteria bacterium]